MKLSQIYLSPPHLSNKELRFVQEAFATNWIAPVGPHVDNFETEFAAYVKADHAVALSSGTAALHLALLLHGVGLGDEVLVSTLTFAASVNPILYVGAKPIFIDSERTSWNIDPELLCQTLKNRATQGRLPKAVVIVHLYGQSANMKPILKICTDYNVPLIEDAAEAVGTTYQDQMAGTLGHSGFYSFNGNKIITTSSGGMLVSNDSDFITHARKLATQAREPTPHYEHTEIGYNYRMSNVLAAIGRGQLRVIEDRVLARRRNFSYYRSALCDFPGIAFMPEAPWGRSNRWLSVLTVDPKLFGSTSEDIRLALAEQNIESRPVWKPMHLQPVFSNYESVGGSIAEQFFDQGLCLPSGSNMVEADLSRVVKTIKDIYKKVNS